MPIAEPNLGMWLTFAVIFGALVLYASEWLPMTVSSVGVICALLVLFRIVPVTDAQGVDLLPPEVLLAGFASPALLAVAALLVIGQGLVQSGALEAGASLLLAATRGHPIAAAGLAFLAVLVISGVLNNIPVVVIFIPIMQALAERLGRSASRLMAPLSFAAILGGMLTLIGSSTNLLVSGELEILRGTGFSFFEFTVPGAVLAAVGLVYVLLIAPRLLPDRAPLATELDPGGGKQFIAQITVSARSKLAGAAPRGGFFPSLKDVTVRMVMRREHAFVPPFEDLVLEAGDVLVVAATRRALTDAVKGDTDMLTPELAGPFGDDAEIEPVEPGEKGRDPQVLQEVMVTPASRMIGQTLEMIGFRYRFGCVVLGIGRRTQMLRQRVTEIRLEAGDVLLIMGPRSRVLGLRGNHDVLPIEWSATELADRRYGRRALGVFVLVVAAAASGLVPVVVAALTGAVAMLVAGVLNTRQASRALDGSVIATIAAALALGAALQATGGAMYLAAQLLAVVGDAGPAVALSAFFLLVAVLSNLISTKATAVLFTPIALSLAQGLDVPVEAFAVAVVFGANCCFASPIGYQTNLLVMAPGHYRFTDFVLAGVPLTLLIWLTFSLFAPWYYGL